MKNAKKSLPITEPSGCVVEVFGNGLGTKVEVDGNQIHYVTKIEEKMDLDGMQVSITFRAKEMTWHNELKI